MFTSIHRGSKPDFEMWQKACYILKIVHILAHFPAKGKNLEAWVNMSR